MDMYDPSDRRGNVILIGLSWLEGFDLVDLSLVKDAPGDNSSLVLSNSPTTFLARQGSDSIYDFILAVFSI